MLLNDLHELKVMLDIDPLDTSEDKALSFYLEQASEWIEELVGRPLAYKSRTEFYSGTGTKKLPLKCRPVFASPTIQVWTDTSGYYGTPSDAFPSDTAQTYGTDFTLNIDQEDGNSRSGILVKINGLWDRPMTRQTGFLSPFQGEGLGNIKVTYTAGYKYDTLPAMLRLACAKLVARLRYVFPLGVELNSDAYETTNVGIVTSEKSKLLALVKPLVLPYKNWSW